MIITLVGYRGSGKSTVGAELAARIGWTVSDSDEEIERRAGMTIEQIFSRRGEPIFRQMEREVLADLLGRDRLVISAGGGAVGDERTRSQMKGAGPVVWLQGSVETLLARIASDPKTGQSRPALTSLADPESEVRQVLAAREPLYAEVADVVVATDGKSVSDIVDEIVARLPGPRGDA